MTNKRYFKVEYDEEWYLFDNNTISEELVKEQAEYGYGVFANSLSPSEICDRLNNLHQENQDLKFQLDECANNKLYSRRKLEEENEQLHHELEQIKEYLQIKIDECKNHKKMEEIVFGVEQAVGYEKALLQFQKGLKRRLNDE